MQRNLGLLLLFILIIFVFVRYWFYREEKMDDFRDASGNEGFKDGSGNEGFADDEGFTDASGNFLDGLEDASGNCTDAALSKFFKGFSLPSVNTPSWLLTSSTKKAASTSTQQGKEYTKTKPTQECPDFPDMNEYVKKDTLPDMSQYIRKDSIPCWNCSLP